MASPKLQKARKLAQMDRLKRKGEEGYNEFYRDQPLQKLRAEENEKIRKARLDVKKAEEDFELAKITGKDLKKAQEAVPVARMVLARLLEEKRANKHPGVKLTSAGGES